MGLNMKCPGCGKELRTKSDQDWHKGKCPAEGSRDYPIECCECGLEFKSEAEYERHLSSAYKDVSIALDPNWFSVNRRGHHK